MRIMGAQARRYLFRLHFGSRSGLMSHVKGLGSLQFDPLNVVGRNPDLVLQSRIENYQPAMLFDALYSKERVLMDGFDKNMCIFPVEDFPCFRRIRNTGYGSMYHAEPVVNSYPRLIEEIKARGPLCSSDIDFGEKVDWPWGPTNLSRAAMEGLWFRGELILSHKKGTQRYYDLIENHLPGELITAPDPHPDDADYYAWLLLRRISAVGLLWNRASDAFLFMPGFTAARRAAAFKRLEEQKRILPVEVEGLGPMFIPAQNEQVLMDALEGRPDSKMRFIAPLDNLIWDRKLIEALFGFYYRWEVYTPQAKREYGYYVLPVAHGDRFVARFEPEHFRKGELIIKHWWWEKGVKPTRSILLARENALKSFCQYLGASDCQIQVES